MVSNPYQPRKGMRYQELDTPCLLLDLDILESNIAKMAAFVSEGPTALRPHSKTHKCPVIAQKQIKAGAIGICCQKLGEAEVMCAHGIRDILITNQIVGSVKISRLMELAHMADVKVAVDDFSNVAALADTARAAGIQSGVVIEVDVGMGRCGVKPGEATVELAKFIEHTPGIKLRGLMGYEGHCVDLPDFQERQAKTRDANALLVKSKKTVENAGIEVGIVSAGSTGTYMITGRCPGITEIEAGSYVLMDTSYRKVVTDFDLSLTVLATVTSRPAGNVVTLDCGVKTLAGDYGTPEILGLPPVLSCGLSEEHSTWVYRNNVDRMQVGDKVRVLPAHCCTTVNLHDYYYVIRGDCVVDIWPIAAARKTQ